MILVSSWGQTYFRQPPSAQPRECIDSDNFCGLIHPGDGAGGRATDEQWAEQMATAAMRGNLVKLFFRVPLTPGSRLNTGWVTIYRASNAGMRPDKQVTSVCKYEARSGAAIATFSPIDETQWLRLRDDLLASLRHPNFARLMFSDVYAQREYTSLQPYSIHYTVPVAPRLLMTPDWKQSCKTDTKHLCMVTNN